MLTVKWPKGRVAGSHPDAWPDSGDGLQVFLPNSFHDKSCLVCAGALGELVSLCIYLAAQKSCVAAEDVTGQLGQPRQEVCVSVVDSPGTEAEGWVFHPINGSVAPMRGPQAWALPGVRGTHVRDGGSTAVHAHEHLSPLPGSAGTQGWGAKAPSPLYVDSQESCSIVPWRRTLENMESSEKAIIW